MRLRYTLVQWGPIQLIEIQIFRVLVEIHIDLGVTCFIFRKKCRSVDG